jgi:dUTP pyrophosphatase
MTYIIFEKLHEDVVLPIRATEHSAGYDILAYLRGRTVTWYDAENEKHVDEMLGDFLRIPPGARVMVPTGFKTSFAPGIEAQVRARSGLSLKQGLAPINTPGTVDADYPGEWFILLGNHASVDVFIGHGDRVAQVVFNHFAVIAGFLEGYVKQSTDRVGGFGSTSK